METEPKQLTKAEIMAQLQDAIEVQELQTKLQMLRTQLVMSRYDEVKYTIAFNDMTKNPEDEGSTGDKEVQNK